MISLQKGEISLNYFTSFYFKVISVRHQQFAPSILSKKNRASIWFPKVSNSVNYHGIYYLFGDLIRTRKLALKVYQGVHILKIGQMLWTQKLQI